MPSRTTPTEQQEQRVVVEWLHWHGVLFAHPPNGGYRTKAEAGIFKAMGTSSGLPDLLIFDAPPSDIGRRGAAIELKRQRGGRVSEAQSEWLDRLKQRGWATAVCKGADEAIRQLTEWGYGKRGAG